MLVFFAFSLLLRENIVFGQTSQELTALSAIYSAWEDNLSPQVPPWTGNLSLACTTPSFYGLTCTTSAGPVTSLMYVG
jgi:hypothetical protein